MRAQICLEISVRHSFRPVIILRGNNFCSHSFFEIFFFFFTQFHWKRTCDTNMRDNNFFATKTLACGTKTWPINNFFAPNHSRAVRKPFNKLWPAVNDWRTRTLHYSYCKVLIYHSMYTILQRTPTILLHWTNCTQQRNATYRLYSFSNIISFHHICVCVCVIDNTVFQLCIVWVNH